MPSYLTQYPEPKGRLGIWCGPDIRGRTWQEAERVLDVLKELGMVHPEIKIIGKLYHEQEWEGYYG